MLFLFRNLSDLDKDGQMTQQEFNIAMHLIQCKLKGINLPTSLPLSLKTSSRGNAGASLLNPVENGFNTQSASQTTGWSSTVSSGLPSQSATGWSVGLASSLPPPLLPVNNQMQTSAAPVTSRLPTSSSHNFTPSFGLPTSNGLGISSIPMSAPMPSVNPALSPMTMPVSTMSGVGQSMRQHPAARTGSFTNIPPTAGLSGDTSISDIQANSRLKFNQLFKANDYDRTGFLTGK
jgi:epidermal growth factor receptor substrate 15